MNRIYYVFPSLSLFLLVALFSNTPAQQKKGINQNLINVASKRSPAEAQVHTIEPQIFKGVPNSPLSTLVSLPGANVLPISSKWDAATNGRSSHTVVRDPDDAKKLHFVTMVAADNTANDTDASAFPSRRVAYSYSADGGKTWTPQVFIDSAIRLGYPDILLYKRGGVNVPIIAAHNGPNGATNSDWTTKLYIEQGGPGDARFAKFTTNKKSSSGTTKDIGYPSLALSPAQDTLYGLGCILTTGTISPTNPTQPLE
ncbi:MAG: sialidase family protein, partial [Ignavibacteriota bacterium]